MAKAGMVEALYVGECIGGAAFGAALALASGFIPVQISAFGFGIIAVGLSYMMARKAGRVAIVSLILSGVIVSGIFTALLTVVQFLSDPFRLQTIVHWNMGNLHNASWSKVKSVWWLICFGAGLLMLWRWRLNVLALGDEEARAVGVNPEREKIFILLPDGEDHVLLTETLHRSRPVDRHVGRRIDPAGRTASGPRL